ncbi:hypothetical protein [Pseudacidovorax intermedius]|uniref:hypothetical protein n=1 Tax=Pseudacidovorax intermedius TaxID=433924 RepID=UPI0005C2A33F|nr:hypothetical protein [Pseudacidovorax intermedius]
MTYTDDQVIAALEAGGTPWRRFFVLNDGLVAYENEKGQLMARIIEDDTLAEVTCAFLARQGLMRTLPGG